MNSLITTQEDTMRRIGKEIAAFPGWHYGAFIKELPDGPPISYHMFIRYSENFTLLTRNINIDPDPTVPGGVVVTAPRNLRYVAESAVSRLLPYVGPIAPIRITTKEI
jgi:hypothetical protein